MGGARAPSRGQCRQDSSRDATGTRPWAGGQPHPRAPTPPAAGRPLPRPSADRVTCSGRPGCLPRPWSRGPGNVPRDWGRSPEPLPPTLPHLGGLAFWPSSSPQKHSGVTSVLGDPLPSLGCQPHLSGSHRAWVPVAWSLCPSPSAPRGQVAGGFQRKAWGAPAPPSSIRPSCEEEEEEEGNVLPEVWEMGAADPTSPLSRLSPGSAPSLGPTHPPPDWNPPSSLPWMPTPHLPLLLSLDTSGSQHHPA